MNCVDLGAVEAAAIPKPPIRAGQHCDHGHRRQTNLHGRDCAGRDLLLQNCLRDSLIATAQGLDIGEAVGVQRAVPYRRPRLHRGDRVEPNAAPGRGCRTTAKSPPHPTMRSDASPDGCASYPPKGSACRAYGDRAPRRRSPRRPQSRASTPQSSRTARTTAPPPRGYRVR